RSKILEKASQLILNNCDELAKLLCNEIGKPIKQAIQEVKRSADILKLAAEEALRIGGEVVPLSRQENSNKRFTYYNYYPLGPVLAVTPFNFPLATVAHKLAPAIAAGNSVILKPSPMAAITAYNFVKILLQAGLPEEIICLLNCSNQQTERLVQDYRIKAVTFTGSSNIGWHLRSIAHPGTKVLLELGGNSPVIVCEDGDLNKAIPACIRGAFGFSGQSCISVQRIYLHERILPDFLEQFVEAAKDLSVGNPSDPETDLGPLINEAAVKRIHLWVEEAVSEGSKVLCGGKPLEGNLYPPTVLRDLKTKMNIMSSEVFGPIVNIISFNSLDEAIEQANDTIYGLSAGAFTESLDTAFELSNKLNAGTVLINDSSTFRADEMPINGLSQSGSGLEGPKYLMKELSNFKVSCINLG
ncbi:MAG: aldehyde dehydrogenase family protein, partial [Candidatus Caenarcaniphilales bacterium]|nr:aldehyde dehydrogenase family protein [Candidatus Caenarcaniphilales bacterium]